MIYPTEKNIAVHVPASHLGYHLVGVIRPAVGERTPRGLGNVCRVIQRTFGARSSAMAPRRRDGRAQRDARQLLRRRPVRRPRRGRRPRAADAGRRRGPDRHRRRVDPARRRPGRRGDRDGPGSAGDPGAGRGRRADEHRHHPGRGGRGRPWRPARPWSTTSPAGWPTRGMAAVVARGRLPVGAHALAGAFAARCRTWPRTATWSRGARRAAGSGSTRRSAAGVDPAQLILDPGLGFAKRAEHNWRLSAHLRELIALGFPVLFGASRKSYLGRLLAGPDGTPRPADEREAATVATSVLAVAGRRVGGPGARRPGHVDALAVLARAPAGRAGTGPADRHDQH